MILIKDMDHIAERIQNAADYLRSQLQGRQPVVGLSLIHI